MVASADGPSNFRRQRTQKRPREVLTISALHACILGELELEQTSAEFIAYTFAARREVERLSALMLDRSAGKFWAAVRHTLDRTTVARVEARMGHIGETLSAPRCEGACHRCAECGEEVYDIDSLGASSAACPACGAMFEVMSSTNHPGYAPFGEENTVSDSGVYKRETHLMEYLQQLQGNCTNAVSKDAVDKLKEQLRIMRVGPVEMRVAHIKAALKRIGMPKLYEHSTYLLRLVGGDASTSVLSDDIVRRIRTMFGQIQQPFEQAKKRVTNRKNMLSYNFVVLKLSMLLGLDLSARLPLLKSKEKLRDAEAIWKLICEDLGWQYMPTYT